MPFRDLYEIIEPLVLPIGGKDYRVPLLGIADAKRLEENASPDSTTPPMSNLEYFQVMLGPVYDEMVQDNVPFASMRLAAMTAQADYQRGRVVAQVLWEAGGDVTKAPEVSRQVVASITAERGASARDTEAT